MAKDFSTGTYYTKTEADSELPGTYNTGTTKMTIGSRSDGASNRSFDGTIYWVRIYDEVHTEKQMKAVMENTPTGYTKVKTSGNNLFQNYPNPFSNETTVSYTVATPSWVSLVIYDISGQKVKNLVNKKMDAGTHTVQWDGCNESGGILPGGIYYCRLTVGNSLNRSKKIVLLK